MSRETFDPIFYRADDALVGRLPMDCPLRETVSRLLDAVSQALRPGDPALATRVTERFVGDARRCIDASAPVLARLHDRYRLGLVSNFYRNLTAVCDDVGLSRHFDVIVDSEVVGYVKPDPRIFEAALVKLGVEADAATFVGDSLTRDMAGARAAGMRHVWLVGDEPPTGTPCCPGDRVIRSLDELEALLP
ncbi:MAG: HAD family hydrolase [Candidatus Rokubacteria bacterium]|nr:HAD family hydrolase [Candidatus Rokubacteria bacterium]